MIECHICREWFHFKCVKMTSAQAENIHLYVCPPCETKTEGEMKTIKTSDISLLPSPPRSVSPAEPAQELVEETEAKDKGNQTGKRANLSTKAKTTSKSKAAKNQKSKTDAEAAEGENEEAQGDGPTFKSESESQSGANGSDSESSGDGSDYDSLQDGKPNKKNKRMKGKANKVLRIESGSEEEVSEADSLVQAIKKGKTKPSNVKRKRSSSTLPSSAPNSKHRRSSTQGKPNSSYKGKASEWTPLRAFCLGKLQSAFIAVFEAYHSRILQNPLSALDNAGNELMPIDKEDPPEDVQPGLRKSPTESQQNANDYAVEVEKGLFEKNKEWVSEKDAYQPKPSYKSQFQLITSALEHDLRAELQEGFATLRIPAASLATMTSRDLATEEQRAEIKKNEAESMKSSIRYEDDYAPVRYTKKILEDSEALQAIQDNIAGANRRTKEVASPEPKAEQEESVEQEEQQMDIEADVSSAAKPEEEAERPSDNAESSILRSPVTAKAAPSESPRQAPSLPLQHRNSSFSLSSVLGNMPALVESPSLAGDIEDDGVLPDFTDGFMQEEDIDFFSAPINPINAGPDEQQIFENLPVVWTGKIDNPASPEAIAPIVVARQVGGYDLGLSPDAWGTLIPQNPIILVGRAPEKESAKYLAASLLSTSKELITVAFTPAKGESNEQIDAFKKLFEFHSTRERFGVHIPYRNAIPPGGPKEVYLIPLKPAQSFEFLDLMDRYCLPHSRDFDVLLGVFIVPKNRDMAAQARQSVPTPPAVPAPPAPSYPPSTNSTIPVPSSSSMQPPPLVSQPNISALLASLNPSVLQMSGQLPIGSASNSHTGSIPSFSAPSGPSLPPFAGTLPPRPIYPTSGFNGGMAYPSPTSGSPGGTAKPSPPVHPSRLGHLPGASPHQTPPAAHQQPAMYNQASPYRYQQPPLPPNHYGQNRRPPGQGPR